MPPDIDLALRDIFAHLDLEYSSHASMDLIDLGVDSVSFLKLITEIERRFGMTIADEELLFENFDTVAKIRQRILAHLSTQEEMAE